MPLYKIFRESILLSNFIQNPMFHEIFAKPLKSEKNSISRKKA